MSALKIPRIALQVTGMTPAEIRNHDFPRINSRDQIAPYDPLRVRNVRIAAGLTVTSDELDKEREALEQRESECFRKL